MRSFITEKYDLNYVDSDEDKLSYILKVIFEDNKIPEEERIPVFMGKVNEDGRGNRFIEEISTIFERPISINPYSDQGIRAFLKRKNVQKDSIIYFTVSIGALRKPTELLTANQVFTIQDLRIDQSMTIVEKAIVLSENRKLSDFREAIIKAINAYKPGVYDEVDRLVILTNQVKEKQGTISSLEQEIDKNEKTITELKRSIDSLNDEIQNLETIKQNLPNLREEYDSLSVQVNKFRQEKESCMKIIEERDRAENEIIPLREEYTRLSESLPAMRREKEQLADVLSNYILIKDKYDKMTEMVRAGEKKQHDFSYSSLPKLNILAENGGVPGFIKRMHFHYHEDEVSEFLLALHTSQIITLCGDPGTGKTTFVQEMSDALGAKCHIIEVQNNWTDRSDILGYFNPLNGGKYHSTAFLDALFEARDDLFANDTNSRLHIICLDEMNLARVEYYFATFLSMLQTKNRTIHLLPKDLDDYAEQENSSLHHYRHFNLPSNVRFVGTLNMDESTLSLSPKVIDRCFFIEFEKGNRKPQKAHRENGYYPASLFQEDMREVEEWEDDGSGIFNYFSNENGRFIKYTHQMYEPSKLLQIPGDKFADYIVSAKVLPRIKRVSDFSAYNNKAPFDKSNERFRQFERYGDNGQFCDYWRKSGIK